VPDPTPDLDTTQRLALALGPQYAVLRLLGRGGFAEVYEVWDQELERRLAVKVLRPDIAWTSGMLERFKQETRTIAKLQHPNILPIHFVGEGEGLVYYAMPFVEGHSLGDLLRVSGALSPERALSIAVPIIRALQHAHELGLIHRDIKPDNVLIEDTSGRPLLVDFGIAKRLDGGPGLTQTGYVVGTPHYMSPEQALGQADLDARSDLYAMGAVLFQMVTGSPPFDGESSSEIVGKHLADPPPVPSDLDARIPGWLSDVITRCLRKKPADRFPSAAAMLAALSQERAPEPASATSATPAPRVIAGVDTDAATEIVRSGERERAGTPTATAVPARKGRRWWLLAAAVLLVGAAAAFWATRPRLAFENRLLLPVRVTAVGRERVLQPGARFVARLRRGRPFVAAWTVVRPVGSRGTPMGVEVSGTINVPDPRGRTVRWADAGAEDGAYFAPLITNETGSPLSVVVNAGLQGALACDCDVPPGATRAMIGYYPLYRNSTVRVEDARGHSATFRDLGPEVSRSAGVVSLRFGANDLR
jgi:hypothetical protein